MLWCAVSLASAGCGDDPPPPPTLASCQDGWQPLIAPRPLFLPKALAYRQGELIYSATARSIDDGLRVDQIEAQPIAGGPVRVVAPGSAWNLWVEGDLIFFAMGSSLKSVPVAGGTPTVLLDTDPQVRDEVFVQALSPDFFFWGVYGVSTTAIWSWPRAGGEKQLLGTITEPDFYKVMVLGTDRLIITGLAGKSAVALPLAGGSPIKLADVGVRMIGTDATGAYGSHQTSAGGARPERFAIRFAPADGGAARPFWPTLPADMAPYRMWSDGRGGWLVAALEWFDDGRAHTALFWVDSQGGGTRAACNPDTVASDYMEVPPAFTDDAAYVINEDVHDPSHATWSIIKIPRP